MPRRKKDGATRRTSGAVPPGAAGVSAVGEWVEYALCDGREELFFSPLGPDWADAKKICKDCPVRLTCLKYALDTKQLHGTWGGINQLELRFMLGVNALDVPKRYPGVVKCPACHKGDIELTSPPARSGLPEICICPKCYFTWERVYVPRRGRRKVTPQ